MFLIKYRHAYIYMWDEWKIITWWPTNRFTRLPFVPPVNLKAIKDRTIPKTSTVSRVCTFPVLGSGRNSSRDFPLDTSISCILLPLKLPWTAWVMPVARCKVKLYRCILNSSTKQVTDLTSVVHYLKQILQYYNMLQVILIHNDIRILREKWYKRSSQWTLQY